MTLERNLRNEKTGNETNRNRNRNRKSINGNKAMKTLYYKSNTRKQH